MFLLSCLICFCHKIAHRTLFPRSFAMSFLTKKTPTKMPEFFGDLAAIARCRSGLSPPPCGVCSRCSPNAFSAFFRDEFSHKKTPTEMPEFFGDLAAIRTRDPQLRRLLLYPAELRDHIIAFLNRLFRHIKSFLQTDVRFYGKN